MDRITSGLATTLFALRSAANALLLLACLDLVASSRGSGGLHVLFVLAIFIVLTMATLLLPIVIGSVVSAVYFIRGSPRWRVIAMRVMSACAVFDLFLLGAADWWRGALVGAFDLSLLGLLAYVHQRQTRDSRAQTPHRIESTAANSVA